MNTTELKERAAEAKAKLEQKKNKVEDILDNVTETVTANAAKAGAFINEKATALGQKIKDNHKSK